MSEISPVKPGPTMSLVARLVDLVATALDPHLASDDAASADPTSAVAALLVHVARIDGAVAESERVRLIAVLRDRFGLSEEAALHVIARGDRLDRDVDDIAALIEMLGHGVPHEERRRLVAMAYAVAGADGGIAEFEDDLVWRMAGLLGFGEAEIATIKAEALSPADAVLPPGTDALAIERA